MGPLDSIEPVGYVLQLAPGIHKIVKEWPRQKFSNSNICGASEIPTFLTLQYNQSNQYFYDQRRIIYFYGANT